jgi:hypothetical protein
LKTKGCGTRKIEITRSLRRAQTRADVPHGTFWKFVRTGGNLFEHESVSIARILVHVGGLKGREPGKGSLMQALAPSLG